MSNHCFCHPLRLSVLTLSLMAASLPVQAQSLSETVSNVLSNHPQIETSRVAIDTAGEDEREQFSSYFPTLSVTATGGRVFGDNATSRGLSVTRGQGYSYLWEGSLTGRQMLWDGMETSNRVDAARLSGKAAEFNLADMREQLALRAVQSYINIIRASTGYDMVVAYKAQVKSYLGRIEDLVDEGAADEAQLQQARDVLLFLENFEADYKGQRKVYESDYIELTGIAPAGGLTLPVAPLDLIPEDVISAVKAAKTSHAAIRGAHYDVGAHEHEIDAEHSAYFPDFDGEISYLKSDKRDIIGGELEDAKAVVRMNWEFETGGAVAARVQKKRLERQDSLAHVRDLERQVERGVRVAYAEQETALSQLGNQKQRLELNQKLFSTYESQFEGALVSLLQLMQADNQLFNARLEEMNARHRYLLSQFSVLASLGQLQNALGLSIAPTTQKIAAHDKPIE